MRIRLLSILALIFFFTLNHHSALAQGTAFTYQGRLNDGANPANGAYDLTFTLFNALSGGATLGATNVDDLVISNGLFTVTLDYGAQFDGNARWLQIAVRPGASTGDYTNLAPRQALLPAPYAIYAASAGTGGGGIWSLNGTNAYYNGGAVGVGTASPDTRFTVAGAGIYNNPTAAAITLNNTTAARRWEWHALDDGRMQLADFTLAATRLVINTLGEVGIGTATPANKLTVFSSGFGIEHTDGTVRLATYLNSAGGQLGTITDHKLHFFVSNGLPSMTIDTTGNVGIGTATPARKLTVSTTGYGLEHTDGTVRLGTYVNANGGWLGTISNHQLHFFVNDALPSMTVDTGGNIGIGTTLPSAKLEVAGDTRINGRVSLNTAGSSSTTMLIRARPGDTFPFFVQDSASGNIFTMSVGTPNIVSVVGNLQVFGDASKSQGGTSWGTFSDRRLKQDVRGYETGLNEVLQLRPVRFHYRDDAKLSLSSTHEEVGFIAQDVREVIPEAVTEGPDGYLKLKADPIHWAAINAIRQLNEKLEQKAAEVQALRKELVELKEIVTKLAAKHSSAQIE
jgi:hypothetical protein